MQESGTNQATIGKKAMGLKVVNLSGERISFGQASGRHFGKDDFCHYFANRLFNDAVEREKANLARYDG